MADTSSFIGSRISLISKSDIRYEGTLVAISMEESNITLQNVRSFGDEGRRPTQPVLPQAGVFEIVIFKGDDIKDLNVLQDDPAILPQVPASQPPGYLPAAPPGYYHAPQQQQQQQAPNSPWGAPPPAVPQYGNQPQWGAPPPAHAQLMPSAPPQAAPSQQRPPAAGSSPTVAPTVNMAPARVPQPPPQAVPPPKPATWAQAAGGTPERNAERGAGRGAGRGSGGPPHGSAAPASDPRAGVPAGPPGQPRPPTGTAAPALPVPKEDFDFQAAIAKFDKEKVANEASDINIQDTYKKDDFFDMLSCEALAGSMAAPANDRRAKMNDQKRLDIETFGNLGGVRHTSFGRGRGGGGRGPGGGDRGGQGAGYGGAAGGPPRAPLNHAPYGNRGGRGEGGHGGYSGYGGQAGSRGMGGRGEGGYRGGGRSAGRGSDRPASGTTAPRPAATRA